MTRKDRTEYFIAIVDLEIQRPYSIAGGKSESQTLAYEAVDSGILTPREIASAQSIASVHRSPDQKN